MMKILVVMDAIGTGGISSAFLNFIKVIMQIVNRLLMIWKKYVQYLGDTIY